MKYLVIFILFFANNIYSQLQWQWQNPLPQGNYLTDITFVDSLNGYACGYSGTILKTNNSGLTWEYINTSHNGLFRELSLPNIQNGWAMCYYTSSVYKTDNAGNNWYFLSEICNTYMNSFEMINDSVGYACGPDAQIYKTIDGGINWFPNQSPIFISSLYSIDFINEYVGYCGGQSPYLLKTTNGGINWTYLSLPISSFNFCIYCIQFKSVNFGYVCGYWEGIGFVLLTTNGGNDWITRFFNNPVQDIYFINTEKGWIRDSESKIYETTDGGLNWISKQDNCTKLYFYNEYNSWSIFNLNNIKFSNDGWNNFNNQTATVTTENLTDIAIKDSSNVFLSGYHKILGTTNKGRTWQILYSDSNKYFSSVKIKNENEIWAVGNSGFITYSLDNGNTWKDIQLTANWLSDIYFFNSLKGYIIGNDTTGGKIFETTDGGNIWYELANVPAVDYINKIVFSNNIGWISSSGGLYSTNDFGLNWTLVKNGSYSSFSVIQNSIWIPAINRVFISYDLGSSWQEVEVYEIIGGDVRLIRSIDFLNETIGWVCVDNGRVFKTTYAGQSWTEEQRISGIALNSIKFLQENKGWAVGIGGAIIHYGDILNNIGGNYYKDLPSGFQLYQNYPNPFNPSTNIKFKLNKSTNVKIDIFNLAGIKIETLVHKKLHAGLHNIIWNGLNFNGNRLSSGVYYCRIKTDHEMKTIKMVLIK